MIKFMTALIIIVSIAAIGIVIMIDRLHQQLYSLIGGIVEVNENLEVLGSIQTSIDIRLRIRYIEMLKRMYMDCIEHENYEDAEKIKKIIENEEKELHEIRHS